MCPDVETYAPLIHAAFGLADIRFDGPAHPGHLLRVQLADRSLAASNPLLAVAARLVELSRGRFAAAELLDLAAAEPVRRRFRFDDDDLERFARWVEQAGIRWGLDAEQRADFNLRNLGANTWRFGLDRLLLGVARAEEPGRPYPRVLPVDDVDSGTLDLVGRVAEFVDRVAAFREAATAASLATDWTRTLIDGTNALTEVPLDELWQRAEVGTRVDAVASGRPSSVGAQ
jgi:exodeoxyribonuclease V gamma subunit